MKQLTGAWWSFAKAVSWLRVGVWPWCGLLVSLANSASAGTHAPSATSQRAELSLSHGWRFIRQDVPGAQEVNYNDSAWSPTDLPHTWNNRDGEDGGNDYYRGTGWYRTHCPLSPNLAGRQLFLKFDGAFLVTDVFVNGTHLGQHRGGFAAFVFDATRCLKAGGDNVIAVRVNNAPDADVPPLSADFTFFGGLYRDVHLIATDPVHISPLDYGSPGVYLLTTQVSSNAAALQITALVSNASPRAITAQVRSVVTDADGHVVTTVTNTIVLSRASQHPEAKRGSRGGFNKRLESVTRLFWSVNLEILDFLKPERFLNICKYCVKRSKKRFLGAKICPEGESAPRASCRPHVGEYIGSAKTVDGLLGVPDEKKVMSA